MPSSSDNTKNDASFWKKFFSNETWNKDRQFPSGTVEGLSIGFALSGILFGLLMVIFSRGWLAVFPIVIALASILFSFKSRRKNAIRWYNLGLILGVISILLTIPPLVSSPTVEDVSSPTVEDVCNELKSSVDPEHLPSNVKELCE